MRWAVVSFLIALLLAASAGVAVFAATTYSSSISVINTTITTLTGQVLSLSPITGDGLDDFTTDLRYVHIDVTGGNEALYEATGPGSDRPWRIVVPTLGASTGVSYRLTISDSALVDAFGCACWSYAASNPATMDPGSDPLELSATVLVKADTFSESDTISASIANQYTSSRRMTYLGGYWYLGLVTGQDVKIYMSSNGSTWTLQHTETFTSPSVPQAVALTSANGYVHSAIRAADNTNFENELYYIRGTQDTGDGSLGSFAARTTVQVIPVGASGAVQPHGVAISLTGTRRPVLAMGYEQWDGGSSAWDGYFLWRISGSTDTYTSSSALSQLVVNDVVSRPTVRVDAVGFTTDQTYVVANAGGTLLGNRISSAGSLQDQDGIGAGSAVHEFSVTSAGGASTLAYVAWNVSGASVNSAYYDTNSGTVTTGTILSASSGQYYPSLTYFAQYLTPESSAALVAYYLTPTGTVGRKYALITTPNTWVTLPDVTTGHSVAYINTPATVANLSGGIADLNAEAATFAAVASPYNVTGAKIPPRGHAFLWRPGAYGLVVDQDLVARAWTYTGGTDEATYTVTAGQHTLGLTYDGADLDLLVDGVVQATTAATGSVSAPGTAMTVSYGFPIVKNASLSIDGTETLRWFRALDADATAPAGYSSEDLVSSRVAFVQEFNPTDSPTGVNVSVGTLTPATIAAASSIGTEPTPFIPMTPPPTPGDLYGEGGNLTFPGGDAIQGAAAGSGVPLALVAGLLAIVAVTMAAYWVAPLGPLITATATLGTAWAVAFMTPVPEWLPFLMIPFVYFIWRLQRQSQF